MKMLERGKMERGVYEIVDTESLVPAEHLLRKIDAAINWNKLYDMVEPLYCEDNGRPSIDHSASVWPALSAPDSGRSTGKYLLPLVPRLPFAGRNTPFLHNQLQFQASLYP